MRLFSIERVRSPEGELCPAIVMELYKSDLTAVAASGLDEARFCRYLAQVGCTIAATLSLYRHCAVTAPLRSDLPRVKLRALQTHHHAGPQAAERAL